jgi:negative regulator of flagellin synthesis FlgM
MKIEKSSNPYTPPSTGELTARTPAAKQTETPPPVPGVSVSIGSSSPIHSTVATAPPVDAKKVADIKQAISEGRFQINSSAIADSLINDVNDLITADKT